MSEELSNNKEIRVFVDEEIHTRFKTKAAANKSTMQFILYEAIIQYLMDNTEITHKGMRK